MLSFSLSGLSAVVSGLAFGTRRLLLVTGGIGGFGGGVKNFRSIACFLSFDFRDDTYKSLRHQLFTVCVQESYKIIKILLFVGFHQNQTSLLCL